MNLDNARCSYPILFSRDSAGNIREWYMEREGDKYRTVAGIQGGEMVASEWRVAEPKNVGRSNATTAEEQADLEVQANYAKKLRMKYHESVDDVDVDKYFKPMLAQEYGKRTAKKPLTYPCHVQPKLDGIRAIVTSEGAWSRTGKPILAIPHVLEALAPLFAEDPDLVLDGELYNHELRDDFNSITSIARKAKPTAAHLEESERLMQYHVYDCPSADGDFEARMAHLHFIFHGVFEEGYGPVRLVETWKVEDLAAIDRHYDRWSEEGYEGQMVRLPGEYQQKRSNFLLKRKEFDDGEFEIVDVMEGQGNWSGYAKRLSIRLEDGTIQESGMRGTQAYLAEVLAMKDHYVGKQATIRHFKRTPDGKLRFPVAVALHLEERW